MTNHPDTLRRDRDALVPGIYLTGDNRQVTLRYAPKRSSISRSKYHADGSKKK